MTPNTSEKYLIAAAVGPVQEFIAAARKLRDLWYGSYLLSELSKSVARSFHAQGCQLIFPAIESETELTANSELIVANKIIAEAPDNADPETILNKAKADFLSFWRQLCEDAWGKLKPEEVNQDLFSAQIDDFGEFFGAWALWDSDYDRTRKALDRLLAGRKALRDFSAPSWDGYGLPKSSLDGTRESVLNKPSLLVKRNLLKKKEHLDTLGVVKRLGAYESPRRPHFDSFSETAIQPYIEGLRASQQAGIAFIPVILNKISKLVSMAPKMELLETVSAKSRQRAMAPPLPDDFFLMSRLDEWLRDHELTHSPEWREIKKTIRKELYKNTQEPQPYAALIVGDGDHMGRAIDSLGEMGLHREFTMALAQFASEVAEAIATHDGRLIYSGGDDVMAYVPLHSLLGCAIAVNACFAEKVGEACKRLGSPEVPTFSMGAVIVHHLMPLHDVLDIARVAESHAKNEAGRDALTIIRAKRGGAPITVYGKWGKPEKPGFTEELDKMIGWYDSGKLPSRLGYNLKMTAKRVNWRMHWEITDGHYAPANPTAAEAIRTVLRKQSMTGASFDRSEAEQLLGNREDLRRVADELVVAHQLSQAGLTARGQWRREREGE